MESELPGWAKRDAGSIMEAMGLHAEDQGAHMIADALVAAERRGIERAAKVADKREVMSGKVAHPAAVALLQALPLAIRQLGEEPTRHHNGEG